MSSRQLGRRSQVKVRRRRAEPPVASKPEDRPPDVGVITCGDLLLDLDAHQVFADGSPIHLSHKQFSVLSTLVWRAGTVVTTDELRHVAADGGTSTANTVRATIAQLRTSLGRGRRRPSIEVARSRGYLVVAPSD
jgi:DNA-binding response OmpR family regulator